MSEEDWINGAEYKFPEKSSTILDVIDKKNKRQIIVHGIDENGKHVTIEIWIDRLTWWQKLKKWILK